MLDRNLIKIYEQSFRDNREMSALTDYFKGESFSYDEKAKECPYCRTSRPTT